jgi:CubicO group peptidase (beta-lactamase class C family)
MRRLFLSALVFAVVTACAPAQHLRGNAITQHYRIQLNPNLTPELQKKTFWTSTAQSVAVTTVEGVPPGELTDPKSVVSHPLAGAVAAAGAQQPNAGQKPLAAAPNDRTISAVDELARNALPKLGTGSLTVGIVAGGRLRWSKSYGYADMEQQIPATADTMYRIGSITKQFTALMFLQLVQDGKVNLSDPVEKYFPEVNLVQGRFPFAPPITLVQLATHISGFDENPQNNRKYMVGPVADWEKTTIEALKQTRYVFEPGTKFGYSNIGYAVLAAALSRAARQPYTEYVRQHIWEPLGMTQTTFEPDPRMRAKIAKGYHLKKNGQAEEGIAEQLQYHGYEVPAGSVFTTVGDLAKFVVFELGGGPATVLQPQALEQNFQRIITTNENFTSGYAVGYEVQRRCNSVYFGHQGGMWGYVADAFFNLPTKTGVIVLHNATGDKFEDEEFMLNVFEKLFPSCELQSRHALGESRRGAASINPPAKALDRRVNERSKATAMCADQTKETEGIRL